MNAFAPSVVVTSQLAEPRVRSLDLKKEDTRNQLILGHNVYSVVLFQLIGTILSAFFL